MNNEIVLKDNLSPSFELINYPDKQKSIKVLFEDLNVKKPISIKCRIKNFDELEVLLCLISALRKQDFYIDKITFVYLFGMRSDRMFEMGNPSYFKDIVSPIINNLNIPFIYIFCPHSEISLRYINNSFLYIFPEIADPYIRHPFIWADESSCLLSQTIRCTSKSYFSKKRENDSINVNLKCVPLDILCEIESNLSLMIVDDLCDGGGTFIAEAIYLRQHGFKGKLQLWIAHGLFTKGLDPILEHFDRIICTNSYQDIDHPKLNVIKVI